VRPYTLGLFCRPCSSYRLPVFCTRSLHRTLASAVAGVPSFVSFYDAVEVCRERDTGTSVVLKVKCKLLLKQPQLFGARWQKYELIALDEVGYVPLTDLGTRWLCVGFYVILAARAEESANFLTVAAEKYACDCHRKRSLRCNSGVIAVGFVRYHPANNSPIAASSFATRGLQI
jgi:hypothetical protein